MSEKLYKVYQGGKIILSPYPALYAAITTEKVFGRLSCSSGMRAKKEHRIFFHFWDDAVEEGYRPCKNCKPEKFTRAKCEHMPYGLSGGMSLSLSETRTPGRFKISCYLCEKVIGYTKADKKGRLTFNDGFIVPHNQITSN